VLILGLLVGCRSGVPQPVEIDAINDACFQCRMIASDPGLAAEIVAPGAEPLIFDDIGCLRDYLAATPISQDAIVYVADHRTRAWVRVEDAVFTRRWTLSTPMGSGIMAHADLASKDADPSARGGESVTVRSILPRARAAGGPR
jgi:copper chaperone NosL